MLTFDEENWKKTLLLFLIFTKLNIFRENVRDFIGIIWQFAYLQIFRDCKGFPRTFWILTNKAFCRKNSHIREHGIRHFCFNPEQPSTQAWSKGGEGWVRGIIKLNKKQWGSTADYAFFSAISLSLFYDSQGFIHKLARCKVSSGANGMVYFFLIIISLNLLLVITGTTSLLCRYWPQTNGLLFTPFRPSSATTRSESWIAPV